MRSNKVKFFNKLNSLCDFLDENYDINWGGCCFVAYAIAKQLDRYNIPYELYVYDKEYVKDQKLISEEVRSNIQNYEDTNSVVGDYTCNHYFLKILDYGFINQSEFTEEHLMYKIDEITYHDINWIYENGDWNDNYNDEYNNQIIEFINTLFKEYEKIC